MMRPDLLLAGLWESVFSGFFPVLLVLIGLGGLVVGAISVYQTRRWPKTTKVEKEQPKKKTQAETPKAEAAPEPAVTLRPSTTTKRVKLVFEEIDEAHPDVWGTDAPLHVAVRGDPAAHSPDAALSVRLTVHRGGETHDIGTAALDADGTARFQVALRERGEHDLIAELLVDQAAAGQAVRAVRIVDYRGEIVETFEDFLAWAAAHYDFVDRKMTAREFVDRYADGRPGTPTAPLETIVDLYELANYSEHPVTRRSYLDLVDAFLELEEAGALEGPGGA